MLRLERESSKLEKYVRKSLLTLARYSRLFKTINYIKDSAEGRTLVVPLS